MYVVDLQLIKLTKYDLKLYIANRGIKIDRDFSIFQQAVEYINFNESIEPF
jgi:hypothetical protein